MTKLQLSAGHPILSLIKTVGAVVSPGLSLRCNALRVPARPTTTLHRRFFRPFSTTRFFRHAYPQRPCSDLFIRHLATPHQRTSTVHHRALYSFTSPDAV